jgi:hypothetical protein
MRAAVFLLLLLSCDDEPTLDALTCSADACAPACKILLDQPPDPVRSTCSPPGPICDYFFGGRMWEYNCSTRGHVECLGGCPTPDLGSTDS